MKLYHCMLSNSMESRLKLSVNYSTSQYVASKSEIFCFCRQFNKWTQTPDSKNTCFITIDFADNRIVLPVVDCYVGDWSLITGRGGLQNGRGGAREVLPLRKGGGAQKVLTMLKGGHESLRVVFMQ